MVLVSITIIMVGTAASIASVILISCLLVSRWFVLVVGVFVLGSEVRIDYRVLRYDYQMLVVIKCLPVQVYAYINIIAPAVINSRALLLLLHLNVIVIVEVVVHIRIILSIRFRLVASTSTLDLIFPSFDLCTCIFRLHRLLLVLTLV